MYFALIGNTPLVKIENSPEIYAKLEYYNPFGSVKDRIVLELFKGSSTEITSGNTGIALAAIASIIGANAEIFLPENSTEERRMLLRALGVKINEVPEALFKDWRKRRIVYEKGKYRPLGQYDNKAAVNATIKLAKEIKQELDPDFVVTGVGTGATAEGLAQIFGEEKVIGVIGDIPGLAPSREYATQLKKDIKIVEKSLDDAVKGTFALLRRGVFAGLSSGANYMVAKELKGKIVIIAHDSVFRYLTILSKEIKKAQEESI